MKNLFVFISFFVLCIGYCHKNVQLEFKKDNITLHTSTHDYNEEINKSLILVEYTKMLLDSLKYEKKIKIFNFQSDRNFINAQFDDIDGELSFWRIHMELLDIKEFLNFIHYIIVNEKKLNFTTNPIDSKVLNESYSLVDKIISIKVNRPDEVEDLRGRFINYSYYFKDNKYYFHTIYTNIDIYNVNNFRQIQSISSDKFIVFLNSSEFELIDKSNVKKFKLSLENWSQSFKIIPINNDYCFIQYKWKECLVFLNLKNNTITEDYYNKF